VTSDRWERIKDVLSLALRRPAAERAATVSDVCESDPTLQREVEELLDCHDQMGAFLERPVFGERPEDLPDELPAELRQWDRYHLGELLGRGGMAAVYKAWDPRLQRPIALKIISGGDELTVKRFLREAEAQARVAHANVLEIHETGVVGRHHYIAMRCIDGPTLLGVREETTIERKVELMLSIAEGLHAAHRQGLVHRDIKPGNILVERTPEGLKPYLLDFGLAVDLGSPSLTKTGTVLGTPSYMAPERIQGDTAALDRRSDIYSLGATFYELISGRPPFAATSSLQVLVDIMNIEIEPLRAVQPGLPSDIDAIVMKCLEKDPDRRYASARSVADDLQRYLNGEPVLARRAGAATKLVSKARKHPRLTAAFGAMLALMLLMAGWGAYGSWRASRETALAQRLGQDVRDIEWRFRAAQMSPLHAIDEDRRKIRERMSALTRNMTDLGSIAFGPGHYALGRGFLALGDHRTALQHLDIAWSSGYRTPDTATALGLAHSEIFRAESTKAQRIEQVREREERLRALRVAHQEKALRFLRDGELSSVVPARYVQALTASLRGDLSAALREAESSVAETPWLFEARLLQAHLEFEQAVKHYYAGRANEAAASSARADGHYAQARRIAASSLESHLGRCAVAGLLLHLALHGHSTDADTARRQAEQSCAEALTVDPKSAEAHRRYCEAIRASGDVVVIGGGDPGDAYHRAVSYARRALQLSAGDPESMFALADTLMSQAWSENKRGRDPRATIDQAVAAFERALAVDPRNVSGLNNMGLVLILRSRFELAHGFDASESQNRCVAGFQRALRIDPESAFSYRNLSRAAIARAAEETRRGIDPAPGLQAAIRFLEELNGDRAFPGRREALLQLRTALSQRASP
jgi:serine/threonine-protein kinase